MLMIIFYSIGPYSPKNMSVGESGVPMLVSLGFCEIRPVLKWVHMHQSPTKEFFSHLLVAEFHLQRLIAEANNQPTLKRMADAEFPVSLVLRRVPWQCGREAGESLNREAAQLQG